MEIVVGSSAPLLVPRAEGLVSAVAASGSAGVDMANPIVGEFEESTLPSAGDDGSAGNVVAMIACALMLLLMVSA